MNERIKELVKQALSESGPKSWSDIGQDRLVELLGPFQEKFAELIVRECAKVVFQKTGPKSALNVLEHFGVEE